MCAYPASSYAPAARERNGKRKIHDLVGLVGFALFLTLFLTRKLLKMGRSITFRDGQRLRHGQGCSPGSRTMQRFSQWSRRRGIPIHPPRTQQANPNYDPQHDDTDGCSLMRILGLSVATNQVHLSFILITLFRNFLKKLSLAHHQISYFTACNCNAGNIIKMQFFC